MKVVAEIGLNHCGSEERCIDLVQDILNTCVDAVTFQIREKSFYDHSHPRKRELSDTFYVEISETIKNSGKEVGFAITRPDKVRILPADFWKTLSWDLCNYELLNLLSTTKKMCMHLQVWLLLIKLLMFQVPYPVLNLFIPNLILKYLE